MSDTTRWNHEAFIQRERAIAAETKRLVAEAERDNLQDVLVQIAHANNHIRFGLDLLYIWMTTPLDEWLAAKKVQPNNDKNVADAFNEALIASKAIDALLEPLADTERKTP